MLSKNEIKYIQSLCHKKQRQQSGLFIVEGVKQMEELLLSDFTIKTVYATDDWEAKNIGNTHLVRVTVEELKKISVLQTPNKVLALVEEPASKKSTIPDNKWVLALDGIQDPGNMGTLIRIADWFGIDTIIASPDSVDCFNPKVIQSTMGSFIRVRVCYEPLETVFAATQLPIYGALLNAPSVFEKTQYKKGVLLIGNESKGINPALLHHISNSISIPRIGKAESLNAAVAAGILLSQLVK
jgi:RNA methyltransferase, TrmH family